MDTSQLQAALLMATSLCLRGSRTSRTEFDDGAGLPELTEILRHLCIKIVSMCALNVCVHIIIILIMTSLFC